MIHDERRAAQAPTRRMIGQRPPPGWTRHDASKRRVITRAFAVAYGPIGVGLIVLSFTVPADRTIEVTRRLERLADRAEKASPVPIETARELEALTRNPHYDCDAMSCTRDIGKRNAKARKRLQDLAAAAMPHSPDI